MTVDRVATVRSRGVIAVGGRILVGDSLPVDSTVMVVRTGRPPMPARVRGVKLQVLEQEADVILEGITRDDVPEGSHLTLRGETCGVGP